MDPHSKEWQERIFKEAKRLVALGGGRPGAEPYGAGRPFLTPLGEQWGEGSRELMTRIRGLGVKIWYRGGE